MMSNLAALQQAVQLPRITFIKLSLIIFLIQTPQSFALKSDQSQPTKFTADKVDFNDVTQEYVLSGKVVVQRGSILVKGVKAVVVVDPEGFQRISVIGDANQLAEFTQQLDAPTTEFIEAQGELILYDARDDNLLITGQAYTVRRSGTKLRDQLQADQIQYNLFTEKYQALSRDLAKPTQSILFPKQKESPTLNDLKSNNVYR